MQQYDKLAEWYANNRNPEIGIQDVSRFVADLPPGATILDLGCGHGIPISQFLLMAGFALYGIDSSARMIEKFRRRFPDVRVECANLLESDFFRMAFDAIVAYGVMFHFPQDDQRMVMSRVSDHLNDGGMFLFNSGAEEGDSISVMDSVEVPHWSMSSVQYAEALGNNGLIMSSDYKDEESGTHIYIARKGTNKNPIKTPIEVVVA